MKTILLTGATGFLGSHLLKYFVLNNENYKLIVLKRSFSNTERIKDFLYNDNVKIYDIDKVDLSEVFERNKPEIIIHCATKYGRKSELDNSVYAVLETNLMFPIKLLELAIKNDTKIFINTDSYFNKDNLRYSNLLNYSLSKKSLNLWLMYFSNKMKIVNVVLEHMYGEDDNPEKFTQFLFEYIAKKQKKSIDLTLGEQKRDFIYIDDVCRAYYGVLNFAINNKFRYRSFDLGTGISVSIKDFCNEIKKQSRSNTKLNFGKISYREDEIMNSVADTVDLENIGISKFLDYREGIKKILSKLKEV